MEHKNTRSSRRPSSLYVHEDQPSWEFLTKKTTFTNGLSKKTTCKKNCQKRPPLGGGMSSQLTRGTCRHCQSRHVLAAWDKAGMLSNMGHAA
jgi:hypothetical protein